MSNVIRFLEKIGSEAQWHSISADELKLALADAQVDGALQSAILNKDAMQFQTLMQQKPYICMVEPAEEEEEQEEESGDEPAERNMKHSYSWSQTLKM